MGVRKKKQKSVQLVMKYRNYKDPLFYDKNANDRIFVPTVPVCTLL